MFGKKEKRREKDNEHQYHEMNDMRMKKIDQNASVNTTQLTTLLSLETTLREMSLIESPRPPSCFPKIFSCNHHDKYKLIDPLFLVRLMQNASVQLFIFDCRYAYEFRGGHINKAIFCPSELGLQEFFFSEVKIENAIIVFHCEFSSKRAPAMIDKFRNMDREHNIDKYPELWYPDVYLLNGGYKQFYETYPQFCSGYVPMEKNKGQNLIQHNIVKDHKQHQHSRRNNLVHSQRDPFDCSPLCPPDKITKF